MSELSSIFWLLFLLVLVIFLQGLLAFYAISKVIFAVIILSVLTKINEKFVVLDRQFSFGLINSQYKFSNYVSQASLK